MSIRSSANRFCLATSAFTAGAEWTTSRKFTASHRRSAVAESWWEGTAHDGFCVIARKDGKRVRLYSRPGNDLTERFPLIAEALARLRSRSCIIDGEAVACGNNGVPSFDRIRHHRHNDQRVPLCLST
jgi:ATP-dependent DNA ligase